MVRTARSRSATFVAFNLYLGMLVMPLRSLGMWIGQAQRATASGERIFQVMDEPEEVADRRDAIELPPGPGDVRFEGVSFEYLAGPAGARATSTSTIAAGRTIALIGHTGSGKTTLTSLVPRFYDVTAGRVTVDGHDVRDVTLALAAPRGRRDLAGSVPLLGDRPGEHRVRRRRPAAGGDRGASRAPRRRTSSSSGCRRATTP